MRGVFVSEDSLEYLSRLFCGDLDNSLYVYKSGPVLVNFFNTYFGYNDIYGSPFPSRWAYTLQKIEEINDKGELEKLLNIVIDKRYIMSEQRISEVQAIEIRNKIINQLNLTIAKDNCKIYQKNNKIFLTKTSEDMIFLGDGGFATVYLNKKNNLVIKKLTDESMNESSIISRFKREFEITKSLSDEEHVINVFEYDSSDCSYTMEYAQMDLKKYVETRKLSLDEQVYLIDIILKTMSDIHGKDIIHRDLSPSNILIVNNNIKISDFGLGKNLDVLHSHKTLYTKQFGQFLYCDPIQYTKLKDGDKQSDVYSLGKIINYIFNLDTFNDNHILKSIVLKATSLDRNIRYKDAIEMYNDFLNSLKIKKNCDYIEKIEKIINNNQFTSEVEQYIYEMKPEKLCKRIVHDEYFSNAIRKFISKNNDNLTYVVETISKWYDDSCEKFEDYDKIADLFLYILELKNVDFYFKEKSCEIINYIAYSVNRFYVQRKIEKLINNGIEPTLEEILKK